MKTSLKIIAKFFGLALGVGFFVAVGFWAFPKITGQKQSFGTINMYSDRNYIDALGTSAIAPITLSPYYTSNTSAVLRIPGLSNVTIAGSYASKATNSILYLQLERSLDGGQTYYPYDVITPSTDRVSVYSNSFATSSVGVPFQVPGSGSTVSMTTTTFSFDVTLAADYVRLSAKEATTGAAGTLYAQLLSTNH